MTNEATVAAIMALADEYRHGNGLPVQLRAVLAECIRIALVAAEQGARERALAEAENLCDAYDHSAYAGRAIHALREQR